MKVQILMKENGFLAHSSPSRNQE